MRESDRPLTDSLALRPRATLPASIHEYFLSRTSSLVSTHLAADSLPPHSLCTQAPPARPPCSQNGLARHIDNFPLLSIPRAPPFNLRPPQHVQFDSATLSDSIRRTARDRHTQAPLIRPDPRRSRPVTVQNFRYCARQRALYSSGGGLRGAVSLAPA